MDALPIRTTRGEASDDEGGVGATITQVVVGDFRLPSDSLRSQYFSWLNGMSWAAHHARMVSPLSR